MGQLKLPNAQSSLVMPMSATIAVENEPDCTCSGTNKQNSTTQRTSVA